LAESLSSEGIHLLRIALQQVITQGKEVLVA
jgi:hypothetical protein